MTDTDIKDYIEKRIASYYSGVIEDIQKLNLKNLLIRKNVYLLLVDGIDSVQELIEHLLTTKLHESKETKLGEALEDIARYVSGSSKSKKEGIDLEYDKNNIHYLIQNKSGPNWGNSSQLKQMEKDFVIAQDLLKDQYSNIISINGCCYGFDNSPDKGNYIKLCGQEYWEFLTGDKNFYRSSIFLDALKSGAVVYEKVFKQAYSELVAQFSKEFSSSFCKTDGTINWESFLELTSGSRSYQEIDREQKIIHEIEILFNDNRSKDFLKLDFIHTSVIGKLNIGIENHKKIIKCIDSSLNDSNKFEIKRGGKIYRIQQEV